MDTSFSSTKSISDANRLTVMKLQKQLTNAQKEVSSGRHYDVGAVLGSSTGRTVSMRLQMSRFKVITDSNSSVATRVDSTQATLDNLSKTAQSFISTLVTARTTDTGPVIAENEAKANLTSLLDGLNTAVGGEYLFSGIQTTTKPVVDYFGTSSNAAKYSVATAFQTAFGSTQSDPNNKTAISASAMQSFLDGAFDNLFQPTSWSANWSQASDQNLKARISTSETIETSSNANFLGYRKLAQAYTMVADLGVQNLSKGAFQVVADKAMKLVTEAVQDLSQESARLGTTQARVTNANQRMATQIDLLTTQVNSMEAVDPYDAAARVNLLMTQMETAYSLTARIQNLSILKYL